MGEKPLGFLGKGRFPAAIKGVIFYPSKPTHIRRASFLSHLQNPAISCPIPPFPPIFAPIRLFQSLTEFSSS
ncbi:hypothetical protein Pyn_09156 [Prunus yedoensis var. nudiflora]|uniref:Uncharacterized protein n=1 Tax=Prunus yedoensis var. nudiflora TaxID=2094558 RepID=A0A314YVR5_PRUYE|nr:hypothetical protein Pyn_09156 [Prunus yedoensis var. nudiflora]